MSATWPAELVPRLALQQIERRVGEVGERDEVDRSGADDAGNRAHLLHLRVDEGDAAVEVLVSEQGRLEGQEPFGSASRDRCSAGAETSAGAGRRMSAARPRAPFRRRSANAGTSGCARPLCRVRRRGVLPAARRRDPRSAGASPNVSAAAIATAAENASTRQSSVRRAAPMASGTSRSRNRMAGRASASPASVPSAASTRLSVRNWQTSLPRPAPSAARTATSRPRAAPRDSSRFVRLTQAISSSATDALSSRISAVCVLPAISSRSGVTTHRVRAAEILRRHLQAQVPPWTAGPAPA